MSARASAWQRGSMWTAGVILLLALLLALFPWGLMARHASGPLSKALGRPVTIGTARRLDWFSFTPTIELRDLTVSQPAWAGTGAFAQVKSLRLQLPVFPLLIGRIRPRAIVADGLELHLVRDADGRDNWSSGRQGNGEGHGPMLANLTIHPSHVRLDDAKRHMAWDASLVSDAERGLVIDGKGTLRGAPLTVAVAAPPLIAADARKSYRARISVRSPLASLEARLTMAHPLDLNHFDGQLVASGQDLAYLDDILQAGLFHTQTFRLNSDVRRDGSDWHATLMRAKVGRSALTAKLDIARPNGRTHIDAKVDARTLDFDDFASDEQRKRGAIDKQRTGPRVVPDTRIILSNLDFDGRLVARVDQLLSSEPSPFQSLRGVATLDHHRMILSPLTIGLPRGQITGTAVVDDRGRLPYLSLDLRIAGSSVASFLPRQQAFAGPLRGHVRLAGAGQTVRDALANSDGKIGLVVSNGSVRHDYATFLGGDVIESVGAAVKGMQPRTSLDCMVADFAVRRGRMGPKTLLLSTPIARGDGTGVIILGPETIDLHVVGRPTRPGLLVSTAPVRLFGTLSFPKIDIRPPRAETEKQDGIVSRVGFFLKKLRIRGNDDVKPAAPANCGSTIAAALR